SDPPVIVRRSGRGERGEAGSVWRPVVFVDIQVGRGDLANLATAGAHDCQTLIMNIAFDRPRLLRHRFQRSSAAATGRIQKRDALSVRRPLDTGYITLQIRHPLRFAAGHWRDKYLLLRCPTI